MVGWLDLIGWLVDLRIELVGDLVVVEVMVMVGAVALPQPPEVRGCFVLVVWCGVLVVWFVVRVENKYLSSITTQVA